MIKNNENINQYQNINNKIYYEIDIVKIIKNLKEFYNKKKLKKKEYLNIRTNSIKSLLKYSNIYHYSKKAFYLGIVYMDIIFQSLSEDIILNEKYEINIINCIILAGKFYEDDLKSMSFERFIDYNENEFNFNIDNIAYNEIICLKLLNYRLNYYSIFDILNLLLQYYMDVLLIQKDYNKNEIFNYSFNILDNIILTDITINYSFINIVFSLLYKANKNFNICNNYLEQINKKFNVKYSDYKECLENINYILDLKNKIYYLDFNNKSNIIKKEENKDKIDINKVYKYLFNLTNKNND